MSDTTSIYIYLYMDYAGLGSCLVILSLFRTCLIYTYFSDICENVNKMVYACYDQMIIVEMPLLSLVL